MPHTETPAPFPDNPTTPERATPIVARVYFKTTAEFEALTRRLDVWSVERTERYVLALVYPQEFARLQEAGYHLEIDLDRTEALNAARQVLPDQTAGIPGYACYRTVEETFRDLEALANGYPALASWVDIGDSWEKIYGAPSSGYDLHALILTRKSRPGPKAVFFLMGATHAREYATAEIATRFGEFLVENYGHDPDVTWLLDNSEIHILPVQNPDGRKFAEQGYWWRKNVDDDDGCASYPQWGTDLNRNSSFKWGAPGASAYACDQTYRGPAPVSEPETQALQAYLSGIFPDQRGPADQDPAPPTSMGTFITLHSFGELVLWPWGWTKALPPNAAGLQTLGRKLAFFNGYIAEQSVELYPTSGTSDDWAYGELGVAAYTFELGTDFFQDCASFESTIYPRNLEALLYAAKSARRPYQNPAGPDVLAINLSPTSIAQGGEVLLTATADDGRYPNGSGEAVQNIAAARFSLDAPSWNAGALSQPLQVTDGAFDQPAEKLQAWIDTRELTPGQHLVFVEAQDADGNWGVPSAAFLQVDPPDYQFELQPAQSSLRGELGESITHTLQITNTGRLSDTYKMHVEGSYWPVQFPTQLETVSPGAAAPLAVKVSIPLTATRGASEAVNMLVESLGEPSLTFTASLTSTVKYEHDLLAWSTASQQSGNPGEAVKFPITLENTGAFSDTYTVRIEENQWLGPAPVQIPLAVDERTTFQVKISIPADAAYGSVDFFKITISSQGDPQRWLSVDLTARVNSRIYLPFLYQNGLPLLGT
ncbi:MAG: M14 family zinc carboxypeptidase [Anaerolineales bacterium]